MHELSIAANLIEVASDVAREQVASRVTRIHVRLGVLCGIMRALYFCFGSAAKGTLCEGAILEIEEVPLTAYCPRCDARKTPSGRHNFRCPTCGSPTPRVLSGREMQIVAVGLAPPTDQPIPAQSPKRGQRRASQRQ